MVRISLFERPVIRRSIVLLLLIVLVPACRGFVPKDLSIAVEVDGKPLQAIDAKLLSRIPPDVANDDVKVWSLAKLLPAEAIAGKTAEVEDEENTKSAVLGPHDRPGERIPVL